MDVILTGIIGGLIAEVYFIVYKKIHARMYGADSPINYFYALSILFVLALVLFLVFLGVYFLYKKVIIGTE
jgi:membrane protease subunit (stomatin/prohibitin family)